MATRRDIASIRFGYGYRPGMPASAGPDDLLRELARARIVPAEMAGIEFASRMAEVAEFDRIPDKEIKQEARLRYLRRASARLIADQHARVAAAVMTPHGFFERLVAFWTDHFTVSAANRNVTDFVAPFEVEAIRPHVVGRFERLLLAAMRHPAMLIYLDQLYSVGPNSVAARKRGSGGLNENLAREALELHTLGVDGGYSQRDVTEFARLLTGWTSRPSAGGFVFDPRLAEPGVKRVLGRSYGSIRPSIGDAERALIDLARHPATAHHLARKLARHFVADEPPDGIVGALEASWRQSGGNLAAVYRTLVERPEAWDSFGAKVKTPFDFVVSGLRAFGIGVRGLAQPAADGLAPSAKSINRATVGALHVLNQPVYRAPGPDGWPDTGEAWITPQGLSGRLEWAARMAAVVDAGDPLVFLGRTLGETASANTRRVVAAAGSRVEGIALVLASPEFNRR